MTERKMATIRRIDAIFPIEGADKIEVAVFGGWKVVVNKGLYKAQDLVVYCEIDSWIPKEVAPFLTKEGKEPKEYLGINGERLRTVKLRGQISQGLVLPLEFVHGAMSSENSLGFSCEDSALLTHYESDYEGMDVSELLNVKKWEPPAEFIAANAKGNFPSFIPKTDQERIQNLARDFSALQSEHLWEITEKLDGSSLTAYVFGGQEGVCSRNLDLEEEGENTFWTTAKKYNLIEIIKSTGRNLAIQGEMYGTGINGNLYNLTDIRFACFDIFDIDKQEYLLPDERLELCDTLGIPHTYVIEANQNISTLSIKDILDNADGKSQVNPKSIREGYVYKSMTDPNVSFKAIGNSYLLKKG